MSEKDYVRATKRVLSELKPEDLANVKDWDDLVKLITRKTSLENQSNLFQVVTEYWEKKFEKDKEYAGRSIKDIIKEVRGDVLEEEARKEKEKIEEAKDEPLKDIKKDIKEALPRDVALRAYREERETFWRDKGLGLTYDDIKYAGIERRRNPEKYLKEFYGLTEDEARRKWNEYREEAEIRGM